MQKHRNSSNTHAKSHWMLDETRTLIQNQFPLCLHYTWTSSCTQSKECSICETQKSNNEKEIYVHDHCASPRYIHTQTLCQAHTQQSCLLEVAVANEQVVKSGQFSVSAFSVQTIQNTSFSKKICIVATTHRIQERKKKSNQFFSDSWNLM